MSQKSHNTYAKQKLLIPREIYSALGWSMRAGSTNPPKYQGKTGPGEISTPPETANASTQRLPSLEGVFNWWNRVLLFTLRTADVY